MDFWNGETREHVQTKPEATIFAGVSEVHKSQSIDQLGLGERVVVICLNSEHFFPVCDCAGTLDRSEHAKRTTQDISLIECGTSLSVTRVNVQSFINPATWEAAGELVYQSNSLPPGIADRPSKNDTVPQKSYRVDFLYVVHIKYGQCAVFDETVFA